MKDGAKRLTGSEPTESIQIELPLEGGDVGLQEKPDKVPFRQLIQSQVELGNIQSFWRRASQRGFLDDFTIWLTLAVPYPQKLGDCGRRSICIESQEKRISCERGQEPMVRFCERRRRRSLEADERMSLCKQTCLPWGCQLTIEVSPCISTWLSMKWSLTAKPSC